MLEFLLNEYPEYLDRGTRDFKNEVVLKATEVEECSFVVLHKNDRTKVGPATVFFSHAYRSNFTPALQLEAAAIIALHRQGQINVYVFDPLRGRPAVQPAGRRDHDGSHERLDAIFAVAFIDRRRG